LRVTTTKAPRQRDGGNPEIHTAQPHALGSQRVRDRCRRGIKRHHRRMGERAQDGREHRVAPGNSFGRARLTDIRMASDHLLMQADDWEGQLRQWMLRQPQPQCGIHWPGGAL